MTIPFAYQLSSVRQVHRFGGRSLLCLDPGLGKSLISLLYATRHPEIKPIVVVCPASVKWGWERQAKVHFGIRAEVLEGTKPYDEGFDTESYLYIVNYDILGRTRAEKRGPGWLQWLINIKPKLVVIDENQFVSDQQSLRRKAVRSLCQGVPHVLALSGTPLLNRPAELWPTLNILWPDRFPAFWPYAREFCLPPEAPIVMSDLTEKPISKIQVGDTVIGWARTKKTEGTLARRRLIPSKVLQVITKKAPLQKVTLEDGTEIICTPDHKWATGSSNIGYEYSPAKLGDSKGPRRKRPSRVMRTIRGVYPKFEENEDYMLGYIHGFWRGDSHCIKKRTLKTNFFRGIEKWMRYIYSVGCACKDPEPINRINNYLNILKISNRKYQRSDNLYAIGKMSNKTNYYFISEKSVKNSDAWWAGFLGGIYDAEGSGNTIAQYQLINPITSNIIAEGLKKFGFTYKKTDKGFRMHGGRRNLLKFWHIANPVLKRKLISFVLGASSGKFSCGGVCNDTPWNSKGSPYVTKIEKLNGLYTTYTITTETGNYIAYGCGSKNCDLHRTRWGWDYSGASNLDQLHTTLIECGMIRYRKDDVLKDLPSKQRTIIPLDIENRSEYDHARYNIIEWLAQNYGVGAAIKAGRAKRLVQIGHLKRLAAKLKLPFAINWIDDWLKSNDGKIILFATHKSIVRSLKEKYEQICTVIDGSVVGRKRKLAEDQFNFNKRTRILIGNIKAAGTGLNLQIASTVAFLEYPWNPGTLTQAEDRSHRLGQIDSVNIYYLLARDTIEERLLELIQEKQETLSVVLDGGTQVGDLDIFDKLCEVLLKGATK